MKKCNKCGETKSKTEFHKNPGKKDGLQSMCKECRKKYHKEHYNKNKEKYLQNAVDRRRGYRELVKRYKSFVGCESCGDKRWWVLDLHHKYDDKEGNIAEMINTGRGAVKKEIRKCAVLCANCHRDFHHKHPSNA